MSETPSLPNKIAVLMGGPGSENKVSMASGKAVAEALRGEGLEVIEIEVTDTTPEIPEGIEICFNVIHGTFGEDGDLQAYLSGKGIVCTGTDEASSRIAFDKAASKEKFVAAGVPTPRSEVIDCSKGLVHPQMSPPYVVKPPCEGSSVGIHIVKEAAEAEAALADAMQYASKILIEEFVEGREMTVAVLDGRPLPVVEIAPPEGEWYDMATKYPWLSGKSGGSAYTCPAELDNDTTARVQAAATAAYESLGTQIYARADVLLDSSGNPYILEVNTIPGMTESSLLPMSAKAAGISFGQLCISIAELSWAAGRRS